MKHLTAAALFSLVLLGGANTALAGEKTVKLSIAMWCASCPYIVKRSLESVDGVAAVVVSFEDQSATVTFDDQLADAAALTAATADVGFPATLVSP